MGKTSEYQNMENWSTCVDIDIGSKAANFSVSYFFHMYYFQLHISASFGK